MNCIFSFCFALLAAAAGFSEVKTIHSFKEFTDEAKKIPSDALVLFDVDEVLVTPADVVLKPVGGKFCPPSWQVLSGKEYDHLLSIMLQGTEYLLTDPALLLMMQDFNERNVTTLGFTSCRTGAFGVIDSMETWRFEQLKRVGIDFRSSFASDTSFPELVEAPAHPPVFKEGILYCGDFYSSKKSTKGALLGAFLDRFDLHPSCVYFFDDEMRHLSAVQEEMEKRNIPFHGYLVQMPSPELNEQIAEFQFQTVLEQKKWISDAQAKEIPMHHSKAIVFDFGGVMTKEPKREQIVQFLCDTFSLTQESFEQVNLRKKQALKEGKTDAQFWLEYAKEQKIPLPSDWSDTFHRVIQESMGIDREMYALVDSLKEKEFRVALFSNIDSRLAGFMRSFGCYEPFDPCLLSHEIGYDKPDPKAYEFLLKTLNLPPKSVIFIDDRQENIDAASKLGIDSILFTSSKQLKEELKQRGVDN